jgi:hypothetical protein
MSGELWRIQRVMRKILGRPALRICAESELGLSLKSSGAWGLHRLGLIVVADAVVDEPVLLASVVCHEAGHEVLVPESVAVPESDLAGLDVLLSSPWQTWPLHRGAPWSGHDWKWIRAVVHIQHRMQGHGLVTVPAAIADLSAYGLSPLTSYAEALGDEPSRLDWVPVTEVLARPCPAEFESLWTADVQRSLSVESLSERVHHEFERSGTSCDTGSRQPRGRRAGVDGAGCHRRR